MSNKFCQLAKSFLHSGKSIVSIEKGKEFTELTQEYGSAEGK